MKNHDFRGVVVAPVFTIIWMSFVIDNITTLDSGFVCRHLHGSILVFFLVVCHNFKHYFSYTADFQVLYSMFLTKWDPILAVLEC